MPGVKNYLKSSIVETSENYRNCGEEKEKRTQTAQQEKQLELSVSSGDPAVSSFIPTSYNYLY
jgi:hypothetical protein